jgi:molybdate transport system regulatory protein
MPSRTTSKVGVSMLETPKPAKTPGRARPVAKFRLRITTGDVIAVGPGKVALLEAIAQTGSITAAAKHLDMSYRRAWMLLDELNRALKKPAVDSAKGGQHGGGSEITDVGRQLIELYRRIELAAAQACQDDMSRLVKLLAR